MYDQVVERLGIKEKRSHDRLHKMYSRFGMHLEAEKLNRATVYRVRTPQNCKLKLSNAPSCKSKKFDGEDGFPYLDSVQAPVSLIESGHLAIVGQSIPPESCSEREGSEELSHEPLGSAITTYRLSSVEDSQDSLQKEGVFLHDAELLSKVWPNENLPSDETPFSRPFQSKSNLRYRCLSSTEDAARREQKILERLQVSLLLAYAN